MGVPPGSAPTTVELSFDAGRTWYGPNDGACPQPFNTPTFTATQATITKTSGNWTNKAQPNLILGRFKDAGGNVLYAGPDYDMEIMAKAMLYESRPNSEPVLGPAPLLGNPVQGVPLGSSYQPLIAA